MTATAPTSGPRDPAVRRVRRRRTTGTAQGRIVWLLVAVAGVAGAATAPSPTGTAVLDALVTGAATAVLTLATAHARRWTWVWVASLALAGAIGSDLWVVPAALAVGAAVLGITEKSTHPALGALVGALAGVSLIHLDTSLPNRLPTALALVAAVPPLVSAYRMSKRRQRRVVNRCLLGVSAVLVVAGAGFAVGALGARAQLDEAVATSREALEALRAGEQEEAGTLFREAEARFDDAAGALAAPWALPARAVPVAGHQARAAAAVAEEGAALAGSAADTATTAPYATVRAVDGTVDLGVVRRFQEPVAASAAQLDASLVALEEVRSEWLVPPLADPLDELIDDLRATAPDAQLASDTLDALPSILGGDGPRRYFVAFANPAETRFQGGFVASYGELLADDGTVTLERSGPIRDLSDPDGSQGRTLPDDLQKYRERYARWSPQRFFQNTTASPDWTLNAEVIGELYPQAGGAEIDGAIYLDAVGLAALLELTGPVEVPELGRTLDADSAVEFLTKGQYEDPAILADPERQTALVGAGDAMFDALLSQELPTPRKIGQVLGPVVEEGHLLFTSFDPADEAYLTELGTTGAFVERDGVDWLSVRSSNAGGNKIDAYLHRTVDVAVTLDPETGTERAVVSVTLANDAPAGLPAYVIGNQRGAPDATNVHHLAIYTPLAVQRATRDGRALPIEAQDEYGGNVYSANLDIPPGSETTVVLELEGPLRGTDYRFTYDHQALLTPDVLTVAVAASDGTVLATADTTARVDRHLRADLPGR